jgi:spoIIIJ-associated protein
MSAAKRRFFSGNTIEQALISAASAFGLDPSEVAYKPVEKKHGFLKVRRRVVIEVDGNAPRREAPGKALEPMPKPVRIAAERIGEPPPETARAQAPAAPRPERPPAAPVRKESEDRSRQERRDARGKGRSDHRGAPRGRGRGGEGHREEQEFRRPQGGRRREGGSPRPESGEERQTVQGPLGEAAAEALGRTLALVDHDVNGRVFDGEERLLVEISGRESRYFLEEHGKALFALEHLLPKLVRGLCGERVFLKVDCDHFREDREEELRELALEVAEDVIANGKPETLDWLNPAERRVVHVTLADRPEVTTESEGTGYLKRLTVFPADSHADSGAGAED